MVRKGAQSPAGREKAWAPGGQVGGSIARWMVLGQHVVRTQARPWHSPAGGEGADSHKGVWGKGEGQSPPELPPPPLPPNSAFWAPLTGHPGPCLSSMIPTSNQSPRPENLLQELPTLLSVLISPIF